VVEWRDVEGPKRVRLEEESRSPNPDAEERVCGQKVRKEPNARVRSQIPRPDFVVHRGPEERPDLRRRRPPRDDQGQGDRQNF
jgi:hypothetical protein